MSHFARAKTFGTWVNGYNPTPAEISTLDSNQAAAIDGDGGGSWAPLGLISIGGSGLQLSGPLVVTQKGTLTSLAAPSFYCSSGNYPVLGAGHTGTTRTILEPFARARGIPSQCWTVRVADAGLQAIASANISTVGSQIATPCSAVLALRPVDTSTLTQVTVTFRVVTLHPLVPVQMPKVRVVRVAFDGSAVFLTSAKAGADASGYLSVTKPTTGAAWVAGGNAQSLVVTCDQNNVVDLSQYTYQIEVVDELYSNTPAWPFVMVSVLASGTVSPIGVWAPSTAYAAGQSILPTPAKQTGFVYYQQTAATSGAVEPIWPTDLGSPGGKTSVTDGTLVWNENGSIFPFSGLTLSNLPAGGYPLKGFGTVWHAAACKYVGIADTRPQ